MGDQPNKPISPPPPPVGGNGGNAPPGQPAPGSGPVAGVVRKPEPSDEDLEDYRNKQGIL